MAARSGVGKIRAIASPFRFGSIFFLICASLFPSEIHSRRRIRCVAAAVSRFKTGATPRLDDELLALFKLRTQLLRKSEQLTDAAVDRNTFADQEFIEVKR